MADFAVEAPHLVVGVYPDDGEEVCFAAACSTVQANGCVPDRAVEVAARDAEFELRSDLVGRSVVLDLDIERFETVLDGSAAERPIRALFRHRAFGPVVVEYLLARRDALHPVGISLAAGALGLPLELMTTADRRAARKRADWAISALRGVVERSSVSYGSIAVEGRFPTPPELAKGRGRIGSEFYVASRNLERSQELLHALLAASDNSRLEEWSTGLFSASWGPFSRRHAETGASGPPDISMLLGRAALADR